MLSIRKEIKKDSSTLVKTYIPSSNKAQFIIKKLLDFASERENLLEK